MVDEVLTFAALVPLAETNLKAPISPVISCTDASPSGGGVCVADTFKSESLQVPVKCEPSDRCCTCQRQLRRADEARSYPCSRGCGMECCTLLCIRIHDKECTRKDLHSPLFGERFAGPRFPLSKAVGLVGIGVQPPLDVAIKGDSWDFRSADGKRLLDDAEADGNLMWSHWSPERRTFSSFRGQPIYDMQGKQHQGPKALRDLNSPGGFTDLRRGDLVDVRQGNAMAKRAIRGLLEARERGRFASLEHPYNSYLWHLRDAKPLYEEGWFWSSFSWCCLGSDRPVWTTIVHNSPCLHELLHKPHCSGHQGLPSFEVHETRGQVDFDGAEEDEYPWELCVVMASAVKSELQSTISPGL